MPVRDLGPAGHQLIELLDDDGGYDPDRDVPHNEFTLAPGLDGVLHLTGRLEGADGAIVRQAIEAKADELFHRAKRDHDTSGGALEIPSRAMLRAQALVEICQLANGRDIGSSKAARADVTLIVRASGPLDGPHVVADDKSSTPTETTGGAAAGEPDRDDLDLGDIRRADATAQRERDAQAERGDEDETRTEAESNVATESATSDRADANDRADTGSDDRIDTGHDDQPEARRPVAVPDLEPAPEATTPPDDAAPPPPPPPPTPLRRADVPTITPIPTPPLLRRAGPPTITPTPATTPDPTPVRRRGSRA